MSADPDDDMTVEDAVDLLNAASAVLGDVIRITIIHSRELGAVDLEVRWSEDLPESIMDRVGEAEDVVNAALAFGHPHISITFVGTSLRLIS